MNNNDKPTIRHFDDVPFMGAFLQKSGTVSSAAEPVRGKQR
ncbi:hypothetical protein [Serratia marcescens]|nr:hypothetical protein [Serratia marcescens]